MSGIFKHNRNSSQNILLNYVPQMPEQKPEQVQLQARVTDELVGKRLDQAIAQLFPDYSRSRLQGWIKDGCVTVDGELKRTRDKLQGGELICVEAELARIEHHKAEAMELEIIYEDDDILVINKPAGLVVHPAAGHADGTLLNALLHHVPDIAQVPRAGIVHRLDMDTTGLMVVAKTIQAQTELVVVVTLCVRLWRTGLAEGVREEVDGRMDQERLGEPDVRVGGQPARSRSLPLRCEWPLC
jgi:23S rRNA pseudouridine1911/1915/1917 synthase